MRYSGVALVLACLGLLTAAAPPPAPPGRMDIQGVLRTAGGMVVDGDYPMKISLFGDALGQTTLWSDSYLAVPVAGGVFNLTLGTGSPLDLNTLAGASGLWLGITVEKEVLPVTPLATVAYAIRAAHANVCDTLSKTGSGSGLDADLLDGKDLSEILTGVATEAKQDVGLANDAAIIAGLAPLATSAEVSEVRAQVGLLGANSADNAVSTALVTADPKGSVLERLQALQQSLEAGFAPKTSTYSDTCTDFATGGWSSREACLRDGRWHRFGAFTQKVAVPEFATLQALINDGADVRVQYTGANRAVVNISRIIRDCNGANRFCLYAVRESGTTWATLGMYLSADATNGNYWIGAPADTLSLDAFFQGTSSSIATAFFDFTVFVRAGGWRKYGTFGGGVGLTPTQFAEIRALALQGARFKVASESVAAYKTIVDVVRVIPECGATCLWLYARREQASGSHRTLGMELSTGATNGNYWVGDAATITSLDSYFTGTGSSAGSGNYLYSLYVEP